LKGPGIGVFSNLFRPWHILPFDNSKQRFVTVGIVRIRTRRVMFVCPLAEFLHRRLSHKYSDHQAKEILSIVLESEVQQECTILWDKVGERSILAILK
jgi:hypothetical protein